MDSNFQYAEAVKLVVARFSCARCLGRVGAPVGELRFSSFFMRGKRLDGAWLLDIDGLTPLALIAARFEDQVDLAESLHRGQSAAEEAKRLLDVRWPGASGVPVMGIAGVH